MDVATGLASDLQGLTEAPQRLLVLALLGASTPHFVVRHVYFGMLRLFSWISSTLLCASIASSCLPWMPLKLPDDLRH